MRKLGLCCLLFLVGHFLVAQISQDVLGKVGAYPASFRLYEDLSNRVITDFDNDYDRAAAIYVWMAHNIKYDAKAFFSGRVIRSARFSYRNEAEKIQKELALKKELALDALKRKKAVCQGYSELYRLLCEACGIECSVVSGYSRTSINDIGRVRPKADHAWNVIRLNNQWLFVDVTWGAGHVNYQTKQFVAAFTPSYFAVEPDVFTYNHFPEEPKWNFTNLTLKTFSEQPLVYHSFFGKGFELINPKYGIIKKIRKGRINIELKGNGNSKHGFNYAFRDMKYMQDVEVHNKGQHLILSINPENRRSAYLDIIIDGETVMTYQLKLR